ncbi:putative deoxyribonuclease TATDN2, partial [Heteronotia binoei]|uniref:putative deoxyribonuclease TATDN2 n=1 Tax=Heteronotia binoei TaxID=13085 RepID=UPI00292EB739
HSAGEDDPSCRKTTQKEQINICVQQDKKDSHGSDGSSRRVSVVSRSEREEELTLESSFQKSGVNEENSSNCSGKEDVRPGCSSRPASGTLRLEDEPDLTQEPKNRSSPAREDINTSVGQNKKKLRRFSSSSGDVANFSRLEGEQKHKQASNKQQSKIDGETDCTNLGKKESWTPENNSRPVSEGARHEGKEVFRPGSSNQKSAAKESAALTKQKNVTKEQCTAPSLVDIHSETKMQFENFQRTVLVEPSSKLVFMDEHDSEVDQKHKEQEKEPSEGSSWTDMEDAEPLAIFSQEDSIQNHNTSETKDTSASATEFVMYPPHLYSHKMKDYAKYWTKPPKPEHCSPFSSPCEDTSFDSSYSSQICNISFDTSVDISSNTSQDLILSEEVSLHTKAPTWRTLLVENVAAVNSGRPDTCHCPYCGGLAHFQDSDEEDSLADAEPDTAGFPGNPPFPPIRHQSGRRLIRGEL